MLTFLLIVYSLLFIFQITILIKCFKNKAKWKIALILEVIALIMSIVLFFYYNGLPGRGFMPGFTYLGETLLSFVFIVINTAMLTITVLSKLIIFFMEKKKKD